MEFERLLRMVKRNSNDWTWEVYQMVDQDAESIGWLADIFIKLDEGDAGEQEKNRCDIEDFLGEYIQYKLSFPEE